MKFIKNIDYLSYKVSLTINDRGDTGYKTFIGGLICIFSVIISIICGLYFIFRLFYKKDLTIIQSTEMNPFVNLTYSNKLPFLIRITDTNSFPYENDEKLYYITSSIWYGGSNNTSLLGSAKQYSQSLIIEKCDINIHFPEEYKKYFINIQNLSSYYCLQPRNYSQTIYGLYGNYNPFSYYSFTFRFCKNSTQNNNFCYSKEDIINNLKSPYLDILFIDSSIDSLNTKEVKNFFLRKERYELSLKLYKRIWLYFENIKYITDNGIIFKCNHYEYFHKFDYITIDPSLLSDNETYFATLSMANSIRNSIYNKTYSKFQDYIAIIGGVIKIVSLISTFLNHFNSQNSYYLKLIEDFIKYKDYNDNKIKKNSNFLISSSLFDRTKFNLQNNALTPKSKSKLDIDKNNSTFHNINKSITTKIFPPLFTNKKSKLTLIKYKEFVNHRLNIINILKKLEKIQLNENEENLIGKENNQIKNILTHYNNNYINEN